MATSVCAAWARALRDRGVWRRASIMAFMVGGVQILINQGDHWLHWDIDAVVVTKTIATPLVTLAVALFSAAAVRVEASQRMVDMGSAD